MPVLGISRSSFFSFNLGGQQLVKIQHVLQFAFCLPVRLASGGFVLILFFGVFNRVGERVERGLLGLHLAVQARHDAVTRSSICWFNSSIMDCTRMTSGLAVE